MTELEARTLCVDIDKTICHAADDYASAEPIEGARETLDRLRQSGWIIVLHTARHFNHWQTTVDWLTRHGIAYDQLAFGKPPARYYLDDRAIPFNGCWSEVAEKLETVRPEEVSRCLLRE